MRGWFNRLAVEHGFDPKEPAFASAVAAILDTVQFKHLVEHHRQYLGGREKIEKKGKRAT